MNIWRKNNLCRVPASHCPPWKSWFGTELVFSVLGFLVKREQQGSKPCPLVRERTAPQESRLHGHLPCTSKWFPKSQLTKPTPDTSGMMGSSSEVVQQSSYWSPLQNLHPHFTSHIEYCNNFPEREQGMGNAGTIIISSVVQQLPFLISNKWSTAFPCTELQVIQAARLQPSAWPILFHDVDLAWIFGAVEAKQTWTTQQSMRNAQEVWIRAANDTRVF